MSDRLHDVAAGKAAQRFSFYKGRSNRKEYWIFVGAMIAAAVVIQLIGFKSGSGAFAAVTAMMQARRLRDFGWSGWWAVLILAVQFALGFAGAALHMPGLLLLAVLATLVPLIAIGAIPGAPGENKYGPAPGQRILKDVFN